MFRGLLTLLLSLVIVYNFVIKAVQFIRHLSVKYAWERVPRKCILCLCINLLINEIGLCRLTQIDGTGLNGAFNMLDTQ